MTPRLPAASPRKVIRALERCGWTLDRVKGSHHIFRHLDRPNRVVVAMHGKGVPKGTLSAIIAASGVSREEFLRHLS